MTDQDTPATVDQVCDLLATWESIADNSHKYIAVARYIFAMLSAPDTITVLLDAAGHHDVAKRLTRALLDRIALDALPNTTDEGWPIHDRFCVRNLYVRSDAGFESHITNHEIRHLLTPKNQED